jgi:TetR/AcrR family transcriptional regulator, regulator of cefoperazone and chloramphenicol sensitivity
MTTEAGVDQSIDQRLLGAAIDHFGQKGLEGASTRAIAAAAGTTMSSITYHYGGKEGLYLAAVRHIANQIGEHLDPALAPTDPTAQDSGPEAASRTVLSIVDRFLGIILRPETEAWARLIAREQMGPTVAFDALYTGVMGRAIDHLSALLVRIGEGRWDDTEARLKALAIIGQALVFRVGRATLLRAAGWTDVDAEGAAAIRRVVLAHTKAVLTDRSTDRGEEVTG